MPLDLNDERQLYQLAQNWTDMSFIGEVPEQIFPR
jgi:hypothetical protein